MFDDLDKTLEALLQSELPPGLVRSISFATPDETFPPDGEDVTFPALDLFLYDIRENRDLRSNEWSVERQTPGSATRQRAPVRVDCSYLMTAWVSGRNATQEEHRLLGAVMQVLLRHPTVPTAMLQGSLVTQTFPLPAISLQPGRVDNITELWQALGGKPRAALHYVVTLSVAPSAPVQTPLVTEKALTFRLARQTAP
jgi:hypothetical protein